MKLRLKGDSVRLRLGPGEVGRLLEHGSVAERTRLGPAELGYRLEASAAATAVSATFDGGTLTLTVPAAIARRWATSPDEVGIRADQDAGGGRRLAILIEKDFECLHGEDAAAASGGSDEAYPNPVAGEVR